MGWKYIMMEAELPGVLPGDVPTKVKFPVIFPDKLVHSDVFLGLRKLAPGREWFRSASAGKIEHVIVRGVGGDSETLRVQSNPEDELTINVYSYGHGL